MKLAALLLLVACEKAPPSTESTDLPPIIIVRTEITYQGKRLETLPDRQPTGPLVVLVTPTEVWFEGHRVTSIDAPDLDSALAKALPKMTNPQIILQAQPDVIYASMITVMGGLLRAGYPDVVISVAP